MTDNSKKIFLFQELPFQNSRPQHLLEKKMLIGIPPKMMKCMKNEIVEKKVVILNF